ncbi:Ig-like domain-containing protein [Paeniglutamicibacter antarcticus]|uniref:Ig-like domain-containing protein n=1 Tax=Paeniglutamicibacter antarcticus TaxID=494023 RepID=UPI001AE88692
MAENTDGTFVTAGDANVEVDSTPINREQISGQARLLIPYIGLPGLWLRNGDFIALMLWSLLTSVAVAAAVLGVSSRRPEKDSDDDVPPDDNTGDGGNGGNGGKETAPWAGHQNQNTVPWPEDAAASPVQRLSVAFGIVAALTIMTVVGASVFSSAAFTATTANASNTFGAADDWEPPSVALTSPGTIVKDTVLLTAAASDARSGIRSVLIQYAPAATGSWVNLCTSESTPYACAWNTATLPDGTYLLRAKATDKAGLSTTTDPIRTTVANSFTVFLDDPGETARGTTNLSTTLSRPGTIPYTVRVEYSVADSNNWKPICQNLASPYNCLWNTAALADKAYDLRSVAVSGTSITYSNLVTDVLVDNHGPLVSLADPGPTIRGTTTFEASASDAASGVAQVQLQYLRSGTSTWVNMCTLEDEPYSCRFNTTTMAYGTYSFRAVATDEAGNTSISSATSYRTVDNTVSTISVQDPGSYLSGTVTLRADANSTAGISNVRIQTAPAGTTTWTTRCTVNTSPSTCPWSTTGVTDGLYDVRAVLLDSAGKETVSATVSNRRVDNSPLRAADIQSINGSGIAGRVDAGDTLSFSYSQQVNLASVTPGWNGAPIPVTVRLRDGKLLSQGGKSDTIDIQRAGSSVNLGSVNTKGDFARNSRTIYFDGTMKTSTVTINGIPRSIVTVTVGNVTYGSNSLRTNTNSANMVWTPTTAVKNTNGAASSTTPVTESGSLDRDF